MSWVERVKRTEFMEELQVFTRLKNLAVKMPFAGEGPFNASGIGTPEPVELTLKQGLKEGKISGQVSVG